MDYNEDFSYLLHEVNTLYLNISSLQDKFFLNVDNLDLIENDTNTLINKLKNTLPIDQDIIASKNTVRPSFDLSGNNVINHKIYTIYSDKGIVAQDYKNNLIDINSDVTISLDVSNNVDISNLGAYQILYTVTITGYFANVINLSRTVNIIDTTLPVITISGDISLNHEVYTQYIDPGATAIDNYDQSVNVTSTGSVDISNLGTYIITYNATDSCGNQAIPKTRTIYVVDTTMPLITISGDISLNLEVYTPYIDAGATAVDNYDQSVNVISTGSVDISNVGTYTITYNATDACGNQANPKTRTIYVVDTTNPVITISGDSTITQYLYAPYVDPGATATDNYDQSVTVITSGSVDVSNVGTYTLTYTATDACGNQAITKTRTVNIVLDQTVINNIPIVNLSVDSSDNVFKILSHSNNTQFITDNTLLNSNDFSIKFENRNEIYRIPYTGTSLTNIVVLVYGFENEIITIINTDLTQNNKYANITDADDMVINKLVNLVVNESEYHKLLVLDGKHTEYYTNSLPTLTISGENPKSHEVYTQYVDAGATAEDLCNNSLTSAITTLNYVDVSNLGSYEVIYTVTDPSGRQTIDTRTVNVVDSLPPVITIIGSTTINHEIYTVYTDVGATAIDNYDLSVTIFTSGTVDISNFGTYTITYSATDACGNQAIPKTRTVNVVDTTSPVITVTGATSLTHEVNTVYVDAGATATDNHDQSVTVITSGTVDISNLGANVLTYNATDACGNQAIAKTRIVNVVDQVTPVITISGDNPLTHPVFATYTDAGATATDDYFGDVSVNVVNDVCANVIGTYNVIYSTSDSCGNDISAVRVVNVVDQITPVITISGDNPLSHQVLTTYTDDGATAVDAYFGDVSVNVVSDVCANVIGSYNVIYSASDSCGNDISAVRVVNVVDQVSPVITISGDNPLTHPVLTTYTDDGATAVDAYSGDVSVNVVSDVCANVLGTYNVIYSASDSCGNDISAVRVVNVVDKVTPVITISGDNPLTHPVFATYTDDGATATDDYFGDVSVNVVNDVCANVIGSYNVIYSASDSCGNDVSAVRVVNVVDQIAPVLTINGANPLTHMVLNTYVDLGATAIDAYFGNVSVNTVNDVCANVLGTYNVIYLASDSCGNDISAVRVVNIVDILSPVITISGDNPLTHPVLTTYTDPGATAVDAYFGDVSVNVSNNVFANTLGSYTVIYTASDACGNQTSVARTVNVVDLVSPVITISGDNPLNLIVGDTYVEYGASAVDNYNGSVTVNILSNNVNISASGSYQVVYGASDSTGNDASAVRIVNVSAPDQVLPVILVNWGDLDYDISLDFGGTNRYPVHDDIDNLFNKLDYNDPAYSGSPATGSVATYYNAISHNNMAVRFDIINANTTNPVPNNVLTNLNAYAYELSDNYVNHGNANDPNSTALNSALVNAYTQARNNFNISGDFAATYGDNSGVIFIHAGFDAASGSGYGNYVWSHKWVFNYLGTYINYNINPVKRDLSAPKIGTVGVICHESLHSFGLPDLYDTDYSSRGAGRLSIMASGSWGYLTPYNTPWLPSFANTWTRNELSDYFTTNIVTISASQAGLKLSPISLENNSFKIQHPSSPEYWLIEYRTADGFDRNIPVEGLVIWHITERADNTNEVPPNRRGESGYKVGLEQSDGLFNLESYGAVDISGNDIWQPGSEFTPYTCPSTVSSTGLTSGIKIFNIVPSGNDMLFDVEFLANPAPTILDISYTNFANTYALSGSNIVPIGNETVTITMTNVTVGPSLLDLKLNGNVIPQVIINSNPMSVNIATELGLYGRSGFNILSVNIEDKPSSVKAFVWNDHLHLNTS